jgi:hypothetical protein
MKRTISFGKVDFNGCGRKVNEIDVEVEFTDGVFTASADVWNTRLTDVLMGGQCLDDIAGFFPDNQLFHKILRLWKLYHLNNMHPGIPEQEEAVGKWLAETGKIYNFIEVLEYLDSIGLATVSAKKADSYRKPNSRNIGEQYTYGNEWLIWPIPAEDAQEIKDIIEGRLP